jgi:hypothetical protein
MLFLKVISLNENINVYYLKKHEECKQLSTGFYLIQALIYDTIRTDLTVIANQIRKSNIVAVKTDCLYFTHFSIFFYKAKKTNISDIHLPFSKSIRSNFDKIKLIEKATKKNFQVIKFTFHACDLSTCQKSFLQIYII